MLNMAFFKGLVKEHGQTFFEPVGKLMANLGKRSPSILDVINNVETFMPYVKWMAKEKLIPKGGIRPIGFNADLVSHANFAIKGLQKSAWEISSLMRKYQLGLADKQCRMSILSRKIQNLITIMVTVCYAYAQAEPMQALIADVSCHNLRNKITGRHPTDAQIRKSVSLGEAIANQKGERGYESILMKYERT